MADDERRRRNGLMREYFRKGYTNVEIRALLYLDHGFSISIRQLRRCLNDMQLYRRGHVDYNTAVSAIQLELEESGASFGYRAMQHRLLTRYGLSVPRDLVSEIQRALDTEGVDCRRRHRLRRRVYSNPGPNYLIHVDGYDKLKRYGFAIHGAICGYSRRVLWYRVGRSNNDPRVIATYFMEYVKENKGVPRCIRCDGGTENVLMEDLQKGMRLDHLDDMAGAKSLIKGSSPSNQRIERWWRSSRDGGGAFWIDLMKNLESRGLFSTSNPVHIECARFCFTTLLEADMAQCVEDWNHHWIRRTGGESPNGKPNIMYYHPELYDTVDYKLFISQTDIDAVMREYCNVPIHCCEPFFSETCRQVLQDNALTSPTNPDEATELFVWLCTQMQDSA